MVQREQCTWTQENRADSIQRPARRNRKIHLDICVKRMRVQSNCISMWRVREIASAAFVGSAAAALQARHLGRRDHQDERSRVVDEGRSRYRALAGGQKQVRPERFGLFWNLRSDTFRPAGMKLVSQSQLDGR